MTKKMAQIVSRINSVKTGVDKMHQHTAKGMIAKDEDGNPIVTAEAVAGYIGRVMDIKDAMNSDLDDYLNA